MFITVEGFNKTGIPSKVWDLMEPYAKIDHVSGIAVLAVVILILSNVASNVPTGMLVNHRYSFRSPFNLIENLGKGQKYSSSQVFHITLLYVL